MIIKNIYNLFYIKKTQFSMQSIASKKLWQKKKETRLTSYPLFNCKTFNTSPSRAPYRLSLQSAN